MLAALERGWQERQIQVLAGMGGVGKTQAALAYAYSHRAAYKHVIWVTAESQVTRAADYRRLADRLGLPGEDRADAFSRRLGKQERWLLICDNGEQSKELKQFLPPQHKGHVLITLREKDWGREARVHPIAPWEEPDAVSFLKNRSGRDEPELAEIAARLGNLPLALEQAGACLANEPISTALKSLGHLNEAKACYERALAIARRYFPEEHPTVRTMRKNLERLLRKMD